MLKTLLLLATLTSGLLLSTTTLAQTKSDDLTVTLSHQKVTVVEGKEVMVAADSAKPGDVIEYSASYRNKGNKTLRRVEATLPIPAGTEIVQGSMKPAGAKASLDGNVFRPIPLKRVTRSKDGRQVEELVPYAEYRFLRWSVGTLEPGKQSTYKARVKLVDEPNVAATSVDKNRK